MKNYYRTIQKRGGYLGDFIEDFETLELAVDYKKYIEKTQGKSGSRLKIKLYEVLVTEKLKEIK